MTINLNVNPYYDDFDESKNYLKILFKPGYAVQARELTQLQTAIQKQIDRFGSHIFKDGSIVLNGNTSTSTVSWVEVTKSQGVSLASLVGSSFISAINGSTGKIVLTKDLTSTTGKIYFSYTNGTTVEENEVLSFGSQSFTVTSGSNFTGIAQLFSIVDSVFFVKGNFVFCNAQTIVINELAVLTSNSLPVLTTKIGLDIVESIITTADDETLLDPAQGSYNYSAPGADRYTISLTLNSYPFTYGEETSITTGNFIELSRYENGTLVYKVTHASYSDLETTLARRTFDESGDYTVRPFKLKVKPHIFGDSTKLTLAIEPGKAYVKGYEFETIATTNINLDKALDLAYADGRQSQADFGNYIYINTPSGGLLDYTAHPEINLRNGGVTIGTARVSGISPVSLTSNGSHKLFIYQVSLNTGSTVSDITSVQTASGWTAGIDTEFYGTDPVRVITANKTPFIVRLPNSPISSLIRDGNYETQYVTYKKFSGVTVGTGSTPGIGECIINTGSVNETLLSDSPIDYLVVNTSTNQIVSVQNVFPVYSSPGVIVSGQKNLTFSVTGITVDVYTRVGVSNAVQQNKSAPQTNTITAASAVSTANSGDKVSLNTSDCYQLISVIAVDTATSSPLADLDVTSYFDFNNGQTDVMYDHGWIRLKDGLTIPTGYDDLEITFTFFNHTGAATFFSADSYGGTALTRAEYNPTFISSSGESYQLYDCLDFRPRRVDGSSNVTGAKTPVSNSIVSTDYSYFLPRIDKLVLTKERKFSVVKGIPAEFPLIPNDLYDAMTLYILNVPANSSDVTFSFVENRRYTMRDIGKIEKRVERMEYYTSLSLLEKQAKDEIIYDNGGLERFKNGILVDSFAGHSIGDAADADYSCSIDPERRILRPRFAKYSYPYALDEVLIGNIVEPTAISKKGDLITLPYTSEAFIEQPYATGTVNLNPYMVFNWNGVLTLDPATDTWTDTTTKPDVVANLNGENDPFTTLVDNVNNPAAVGIRWNDWQTVGRGVTVTDNLSTNSTVSTNSVNGRLLQTTNTVVTNNQATTVSETLNRTGIQISTSATSTVLTDLGTKVVDISLVPFIRTRAVKFAAKNLKPSTKLFASFDGIDVTAYCFPAVEIKFTSPTAAVNYKNATKITSGSKSASVVLVKNDRVWVVMDPGSAEFASSDIVNWQISGSSVGSSPIASVNNYSELETNERGDVAGTFIIPNNSGLKFRTGERAFRLSDAVGIGGTTAAEVKYIAQGLSQSVERTIVATRVATASISPTTESNTKTTTTNQNIVVSNTSTTVDITPPPPPIVPISIPCATTVDGKGKRGTYHYIINYAETDIGQCGIKFDAYTIPDRYTIIWDGNEYTSGFVGSALYNDKLVAAGFPKVANTVTSGQGTLTFNKTKATPTTALLIVDAPLAGTGWKFTSFCPAIPTPPVQIKLTTDISCVSSYSFTGDINQNVFQKIPVKISAARTDQAKNTWTKITVTFGTRLYDGRSGGETWLNQLGVPTFVEGNTHIIQTGSEKTITLNLPAVHVGHFYDLPISIESVEYSDSGASTATGLTATDSTTIRADAKSANGWYDPVAQTFFVDSNRYPNGIFVNGIDLFFKTKSSVAPVQVQLRPVVNGYPSSSVILPFATASLDAAEINVSTTGTVATHFEFDNIVHLSPGEYSFVVVADSTDYEIFTATLGDFSLTNTDQRVTTQPLLGSMFKSQNASTWTPIQEEDIKFTLYKCKFDISQTPSVIYNTVVPANNGEVDYDVFFTTGEVIDFAATNIDYAFSTDLGATWVAYQSGTNYTLDTTKTLSTGNTLKFMTVLSSSDDNITPVVDLNRLGNTLIKNVVNNNSDGETAAFGGNALSKYITKRVKLASGFESSDLKVYFNANLPSGTSVKVYYKVSTVNDRIFGDNEYAEMVLESSGTYSETSFTEYKYKTPYVDLNDNTFALSTAERFDTFAVKIVMLSSNAVKVPQIRDLRVVALDD